MSSAEMGFVWLVAIIVAPSVLAYLLIVSIAWAKRQATRPRYEHEIERHAEAMRRATARAMRHMEDIAGVYRQPEKKTLDDWLRDDGSSQSDRERR